MKMQWGIKLVIGFLLMMSQAMCHAQMPELALQVGHSKPVRSVSFSPNGKTLASAGNDRIIKLWDVATGEVLRTLKGHTGAVESITFSPDGRTLASGSWDSTIKLWDVPSGKIICTLKGHNNQGRNDRITSVAFCPNGKILASGSYDHTIKLWDVVTGKELRTLTGHTDTVLSVAFSPDGKMLASGSEDHSIKLWNVTTGQVLQTFPDSSDWVTSVAFSPDGKKLASGSLDNIIKLWDVASGKELRSLEGHTSYVNSVNFSPDGKTLASGSNDNTVKLWDVASGKELRTLKGHTSDINSVIFSPDGKTLASGSGDNTIKLWDTASRRELNTLKGYTNFVWSAAFSPDGKTIASGNSDHTIKFWDAKTGEMAHTLNGHTGEVFSVTFSPDGKVLASGSSDHTVKLWNVTADKTICTLSGQTTPILSVAFSPDGKKLASGGGSVGGDWGSVIMGSVKVWDIATQKVLRTLGGNTSFTNSVAFSPDNKTLAYAGSIVKVNLWDIATGKLLRTISEGNGEIAFSSDGKILASRNNDGHTIKLWETTTGKLLRVLEGHTSLVYSVAFSSDGKILASGSEDNTIKLWDVATGKELHTLEGHTNSVQSVAFSPDDKMLVSGSTDNTIKLWDVASGRLLATLMNLSQPTVEAASQGKGLITFSDKDITPTAQEWLITTPEGYFDCSANASKYVLWNINNKLYPAERYWRKFRRPDLVQKALRGEKITAPVMTNEDVPPTVNFLNVRYDGKTNGTSAGSPQFVTVTLQAQGKHDFSNDAVQLLVNGRPLPPDSVKPLAADNVSVQNTLPDPHVSEKDPIVFNDKGSIIFSDKTTMASVAPSPYTFAKRFTFRVPLPLGDANVQSKGFQNVSLDAMVFDKDDLGSDHSVIWLQNKNAQQVKGNLIALCVGISNYQVGMNVVNGKQPATGKIANLTYPDVDARAMSARLLREKGGLYDDVTVHTLCDGQVTLDNLRKELTWLQQTARPGQIDTVMVFLSGHGVSSASGKYFFPAYNFDPQHPTETSLSGAELQQALGSKLRAQSVFLFVDSCHSGALSTFANDRGAANGDDLSFSVKDSGVYLLASSGALQTSLESNAWGHGAFTEALIDALKDSRVRNGIVHFDELTYLVPDNVVKLLRAAKLDEHAMSPVVPMEGRYLEEPVAKAQS